MSNIQYTTDGAWELPDQEATYAGKTLSTIETPIYDRQGHAVWLRVVRNRWDAPTQKYVTDVLLDTTDTTSTGFGSRVLTVSAPVIAAEPMSLLWQSTDRGVFAYDADSLSPALLTYV